jgi:hypothetical protein
MRPAAHPQMEFTITSACTRLRQGAVDRLGRAQFLNAQAGQLFAHGDDHNFRIHWRVLLQVVG